MKLESDFQGAAAQKKDIQRKLKFLWQNFR